LSSEQFRDRKFFMGEYSDSNHSSKSQFENGQGAGEYQDSASHESEGRSSDDYDGTFSQDPWVDNTEEEFRTYEWAPTDSWQLPARNAHASGLQDLARGQLRPAGGGYVRPGPLQHHAAQRSNT
jgi:hypothetical protein